jgi:hypothetical protein
MRCTASETGRDADIKRATDSGSVARAAPASGAVSTSSSSSSKLSSASNREKKLVGGSCLRSPTTTICAPRGRNAPAS